MQFDFLKAKVDSGKEMFHLNKGHLQCYNYVY